MDILLLQKSTNSYFLIPFYKNKNKMALEIMKYTRHQRQLKQSWKFCVVEGVKKHAILFKIKFCSIKMVF
jgi:hypothetical protein